MHMYLCMHMHLCMHMYLGTLPCVYPRVCLPMEQYLTRKREGHGRKKRGTAPDPCIRSSPLLLRYDIRRGKRPGERTGLWNGVFKLCTSECRVVVHTGVVMIA